MGRRIYVEIENPIYSELFELAKEEHRSLRNQVVKILEDAVLNSKIAEIDVDDVMERGVTHVSNDSVQK